MRPMDIVKEQHHHSFDKYRTFDRYILEDEQYDRILSLLRGNVDQLILEIDSPFEKGVIVANQQEERHVMYYVYDMEGESYLIHAFNYREGYLFTLEMFNGVIKVKEVHPYLLQMPRQELQSFQGFASNYYIALMFYLSVTKEKNGLDEKKEKIVKSKKKGKKKITKVQTRSQYFLVTDWEKWLPDEQEVKTKSVSKEEVQKTIEAMEGENQEAVEVKGHYRTLRNGKKVWVEGYKREKKSS